MASISDSIDQIIYVGVGIFVLVLILSLTYQGYATSANYMVTAGCVTGKNCASAANQIQGFYGASMNFTTYAGPLPNTFGGALQLAVFALVFIAVILAVLGALRGGRVGTSGGLLGT